MSYVQDALTGRIQVDLDHNQRHALDVLLQKWDDESHRDELASGFRELLGDMEPKMRAAALRFFLSCDAEDHGLLFDACQNRMTEFEGFTDPWFPGESDLGDLLVLAVAGRMKPDSKELELIREEAVIPRRGGYTVRGLMRADHAWLLENASEIIGNNPESLRALIWNAMMYGKNPDDFLAALRGVLPDEVLLETACTAIPQQALHFRTLFAFGGGDDPESTGMP